MKMDLDALLSEESRRKLDFSGCKSAEDLLKSVLNKAGKGLDGEKFPAEELAGFATEARELAEEELDQVNAAGVVAGDSTSTQNAMAPYRKNTEW